MRLLPEAESTELAPQSSALLLKCIDFISDAVLITEAGPVDPPGPRVVFANRAFERMTGYTAGEMVGRDPRLLQGPETSRAELRRIRAALVQWQPVRAELINYRKSGETFHVEMDIVPVADKQGRWTHWVSVQRDVTARKKAEAAAAALETQRYESLGTLSYGIAHDFNNIIAAILGNAEIAATDMEAGRLPRASLQQIGKAALRARSVVGKILAYVGRRPDSAVPLPLGPVIQEAADLLRATLPPGVTLDIDMPAEPVWVRGDASQLCQVLLNLGINAVQSLPDAKGRVRYVLSGGDSATVDVIDTGCGMDAATRARIFEPYFTTKPVGRGTGLGLSVVWGIVAAHGGTLAVDSEPRRGTRVALSLPKVAAIPDPPPVPRATPAPVVGLGEHVLVVDDDEVVVAMLEGMLQLWGFRVTSLHDPLQAVRRVAEAPADYDAVVTDLNMPHLSGLQLARQVLAIRGDLPVILGSGNVDADLVDAATRIGISAVFPKEFAVEQLGALITGSLNRAPTRAARPGPASSPRVKPPRPHRENRMQSFLINNRDELIARCSAKVAQRPSRDPTEAQMANGVPLFIDQLIRTLGAEESGAAAEGLAISGPAGGDVHKLSEIGAGATLHGRQLLALGYSIDQVVHDYGDLCQAITDLAIDRDAPFSIDSYRTLNRCLDNAIADAVSEFATQRDVVVSASRAAEENQRLGGLAHELRNHLHVALLALDALSSGTMGIAGSTGAMLKRNLVRLDELIEQTLSEVRQASALASSSHTFAVAGFIDEAAAIARLYAADVGCGLQVPPVDPQLEVTGNRSLLLDALTNLLQNAFKFTQPKTEILLRAHAADGRVLIDVQDHCGGLPPGAEIAMFTPFKQVTADQRGLGLGLAIATQSVRASGGTLSVRNLPGTGCVFTIDLPLQAVTGTD